ncbi:hypothetical protein scyTo_0025720, partial [Scyliorhinus torazame]|nr:hypothetical protein [Scyliorhinus torazame]
LERLRGTSDTDRQIEEMKKEKEEIQKEKTITVMQLFRKSSCRQPIIIALMMHMSQQFSGINAVSDTASPWRLAAPQIEAED